MLSRKLVCSLLYLLSTILLEAYGNQQQQQQKQQQSNTNDHHGKAGWKMTDRFYGFRFQVSGLALKSEDIVATADKHGCFGWVQKKTTHAISGTEIRLLVGEMRCHRNRGIAVREWMETLQDTTIKVYTDTKIRLHFSYFKTLEDSRDTCFLDEPHKCTDSYDGDEGVSGVSDSDTTRMGERRGVSNEL